MKHAPRRTTSETRHDQVYWNLRHEILLGNFAGGERLVETALAKRYEVSRTPIREALFRLAQEGLVNVPAHGGAIVKEILERDIMEAYLTRSVLEGLAGSLATAWTIPTDVIELEYIVRKTRVNMEVGNLPGVLENNTEFHSLLARLSRNEYLINQLDQMRPYTYLFRRNMLRAVKSSAAAHDVYLEHLTDNVVDHDRIIGLLREKRAKELEGLMRQHMVKSSDCMIRILGIVREERSGEIGSLNDDDILAHLPDLDDDVAFHLLESDGLVAATLRKPSRERDRPSLDRSHQPSRSKSS